MSISEREKTFQDHFYASVSQQKVFFKNKIFPSLS